MPISSPSSHQPSSPLFSFTLIVASLLFHPHRRLSSLSPPSSPLFSFTLIVASLLFHDLDGIVAHLWNQASPSTTATRRRRPLPRRRQPLPRLRRPPPRRRRPPPPFAVDLASAQFYPLYEKLRITQGKEGKEEIKKQIIEGSMLLEEEFVKTSNGKAYFGGDDLGYLDVVLGCLLAWTKFVGKHNEFKIFDEVRTPRLVEWTKRIWSHEACKGVIAKNETIVGFYMMLQKYRPLGDV